MTDLQQKLQKILDDATSDPNKVPSLILWVGNKKGETLFHGASGVVDVDSKKPATTDNVVQIFSCTKLLTAISVMQLVEAGKVDLDQPAEKYNKSLVGLKVIDSDGSLRAPSRPFTVREALTHTAGSGYPFFDEPLQKYFDANGIEAFECTRRSVLGTPLLADPATEWRYSAAIDFAGQVVEGVSGMELDAYMTKHIFEPLGIKDLTFRPTTKGIAHRLLAMHQKENGKVRKSHHPIPVEDTKQEFQLGGAGCVGSASEYGKVLTALLNRGTHPNGRQILKPETVAELIRPQLDETKQAKLIKDLDRPIPAAQPHYTNPTGLYPGSKKNWSFAGLVLPEGLRENGRSGKAVFWAGLPNLYWFMDEEDGTAAMIQTQLFPYADADVFGGFVFGVEAAVHEYVKNQS